MANDVYVKFGRDPNGTTGGPLDTELPDIEGDSTDAHHYWWCELRECNFDIETPEQADDNNSSANNSPKATMPKVTLRKRVDWASPQLFLKCCEAALATVQKSTDDQGAGRINEITVEVCRPAGGDKIPCVTVTYYGVRITHYEISINEPEPAENVTFEFDKLKFKYIQTDPFTNEVIDIAGLETNEIENHHPSAATAAAGGSSTGDGGGGSGSSVAVSTGGGGGTSGAGTGATGGTNAPTAPAVPGAAPDATVTVNFPGLWQGTGFGILPD